MSPMDTPDGEHDTRLPPTAQRALRGYGPLLALALVFALMATLMPTVVISGPDLSSLQTGTTGPQAIGTPGQTTGGDDDGGTSGSAGRTITRTVGGGTTSGCPDRTLQVPGDPYSPPCRTFTGDNGGNTSRGVSDTEIIVSARILDEKGFQQTLAALAGAEIADEPKDIRRTISALADYFNARFQFYGRQIKIEYYDGAGSSTAELLGGGQEGAQADALTSAQKKKAFAEINGSTAPFANALAQQKVVSFGTPYLSRDWHLDHRPYNWSIATDCSIVAETAGEYYVNLLARKNADFAGGDQKGKPRKLFGLSPENPWYAECHDDFEEVITGDGLPQPGRANYRLDINSMSNQAANVIAKLKADNATTIFCGCDPIFPVFLTTKAAEQGFKPEWVVVGVALTDHDLVGQLYDQDQWSRAAGVSFAGSVLPQRAGLGYAAYKSIRKDEPAFAVEIIYAQMYMLALGIHLAGPNLTPESFEQGMFTYPGGTGMYGTWGFGPRNYTPQQDTRIIWWDPDRLSSFNRKEGAYVESYGGKRFPVGHLPTGNPDIFK